MKKQIITAVSVSTLALLSTAVLADNASTNYPNSNYPDANNYSRDRDDAAFHRAHRHVGDLRKADRLIGLAIKDESGNTIGKVKDLALDLQNGRVVAVIVGTGGAISFDRKLVAVPPSLFTFDEPNKTLRTTLDKSRLENAPEFRMSDWKDATQDLQIRQSYQYYGVPTYYGVVPQSNDDAINHVGTASSPVGNGKARDISGQPNNTQDSVDAAANAAAITDNTPNNNTNNASRADVRDYNSPATPGTPENVVTTGSQTATPYANPSQEGNLKQREAAGNQYGNNSTNYNANGALDNRGNQPNTQPSDYASTNSTQYRDHAAWNNNRNHTNNWQNSDLSRADNRDYPRDQEDSTYYSFPSRDHGTNNYDYYHSASYYDHQHPQNIGEVVRGSKVIGSTVYNSQNEKLGKVENFVVDLQSGRIVEVVLESGGFLGIHDQYTAVPPQSIQYNATDSRVTMDVTRDSLQSSPHFKSHDWDTANQPDRINDVYRNYHVEPYFTSENVDNSARNVRDRSGDTLTPLDQGTSQADIQTTAQIRKSVMKISDLSTDGKNVKIITRDGHVTLRGVVNTPEEKREVTDAAKSIANGQVDDQLEVKGTSNVNYNNTNSTDTAK